MEAGDDASDLLQQRRFGAAAPHELVQHAVLGQPPHVDGHLLEEPRAAGPEAVAPQLDDAEIDVVRQPLVEPDLFLAEEPALLERGEVEEPEIDGLLDLVDGVAGQEDPGDVGLDELDRPDPASAGR